MEEDSRKKQGYRPPAVAVSSTSCLVGDRWRSQETCFQPWLYRLPLVAWSAIVTMLGEIMTVIQNVDSMSGLDQKLYYFYGKQEDKQFHTTFSSWPAGSSEVAVAWLPLVCQMDPAAKTVVRTCQFRQTTNSASVVSSWGGESMVGGISATRANEADKVKDSVVWFGFKKGIIYFSVVGMYQYIFLY
jgi:hypothetical protein